eukprot:gb/GECG01016432.1/.p1 GENE.gb/GECG01016432.1/~~gb/GECG01016432.1/.p1  ORF type:complete len:1154 (+),score=113.07 gb/GECG01016432.1/:1-3462(+)
MGATVHSCTTRCYGASHRDPNERLVVKTLVQCMVVMLTLLEAVNGQSSSITVRQCSIEDNEIFSASSLQCKVCPAGKVVLPPEEAARIINWDFSRSNIFKQRVTPIQYTLGLDTPQSAVFQPSQCQCEAGTVEPRSTQSLLTCDDFTNAETCGAPSCQACSADEVPSRDRSTCMPCDDISAMKSGDVCECNDPSHVLVETDAAGKQLAEKTCLECPPGQRAFQTATGDFPGDPFVCAKCPDLNMTVTNSGQCECVSGFRKVGISSVGSQQCVPEAAADAVFDDFSPSTANSVTYPAFQPSSGDEEERFTLDSSLTLQHWFERAAPDCWAYRNERENGACSVIASLCVLHLYNSDATPCRLYEEIAAARGFGVNNWAGWPQTLPFLRYREAASAVLETDALQTQMSFDAASEQGTVDHLELVLASYALNGTLLDMKPLRHQLSYCSGTSAGSKHPDWQMFGFTTRSTTSCDLESLVESSFDINGEPTATLYEVFIVDRAGASEEIADDFSSFPLRLFPVPVRITGVRRDGQEVNPSGGLRPSDSFLVRRFFLFDAASGFSDGDDTPRVITYARNIRIEVETQSSKDRIRPPLISIEYRSRDPRRFSTDEEYKSDTLEISSVYASDLGTFGDVAISFFAIGMLGVAILTGLRVVIFRRKNIRRDAETITGFKQLAIGMVFLLSVFAQLGFWLIWIFSVYWLLFFKLQDSVFQLLPPDLPDYEHSIYNAFTAIFALVFIGQLISILEILWRQTHLDIYFLDWETKRGPLMETNMDAIDQGAAMRGRLKYAPVSAWRKLFMVNEWSELQTMRRINIPVNLILLLVIMEGAKYKYVATPRPSASDLSEGDINPALQFAHNIFWWFILSLGQYLWKWGIYERFVEPDPLIRYIDMCTVAKISVFIFDDHYHGYYLHCDAPYEHADLNMRQLTDHLQDEKSETRIGRQMKGYSGDPNQQSFEVVLPALFRRRIDSVRRDFEAQKRSKLYGGQGSHLRARGTERLKKPQLTDSKDKAITRLEFAASENIAKYLKGFINEDEAGPNVRRLWKEKSYLQRFFDMPWDFEEAEQSASTASSAEAIVIMSGDEDYKVDSVIFRGQEWNLLLWDMLVYSLFDLLTAQPAVAALLTFLFWMILNYARTELGNRNVSHSTMVDDRFLA